MGGDETSPRRLVIATAQTVLRPDPRSRDQLRDSGAAIRALMRDAAAAGAALAHFPEGRPVLSAQTRCFEPWPGGGRRCGLEWG
jgi:hypothetical protein